MTGTSSNGKSYAPFEELIRITRTYCHPEAYEDAYDDLKVFASREDDDRVALFKEQLRFGLVHPEQLPEDEFFMAVQYEDGSAERFLRRLWRDLYPDEPVPGRP